MEEFTRILNSFTFLQRFITVAMERSGSLMISFQGGNTFEDEKIGELNMGVEAESNSRPLTR